MGLILGTILAVAKAAKVVVKAIAVADIAIKTLKVVGNALVKLGKTLGLIKPETKVEDLGDKAIQSEYKPEDYDSYAEYVKAVEDYKLDPEKSKNISEEEKIKKGMELAAGAMIEKYGDLPMEELCTEIGKNPDFFTEAKMDEIGNLIKSDSDFISSIVNYINGSEKNETNLEKTIDTLVKVEKSTNSSISDTDALKNVLNARK